MFVRTTNKYIELRFDEITRELILLTGSILCKVLQVIRELRYSSKLTVHNS